MLSPSEYYRQQKDIYSKLLADVVRKVDTIARLRLWVAVLAIVMGILAFRSSESWQWYAAGVCAILFIVLVRRHGRMELQKERLTLHVLILANELEALSGNFSVFPDGGTYQSAAHPYSYDLDLFGKGSVYQLLCRAVTHGGSILLAEQLQRLTLNKDTIAERQAIIKELSIQPELLQNFRVAGMKVAEGPKDQQRIKDWLTGDDHFINQPLVRITAVVMPALSVAFIGWSVYTGAVYAGLGLVAVANWLLLGSFQKKIKVAVQQIGNAAPLIDKYTGLLAVIADTDLSAPWLKAAGAAAKASITQIVQFKQRVNQFDSRSNGMIGPLMNTLFVFDFYCLLRLEAWRKKHKALMLQAIADMIAMDVYVTGAVYTFNHPDNIFPELTTGSLEIKATDLKHPLLNSVNAVGNDTSIGKDEQLYLLTGANMTGKSTFIRTIGVSNVMANMGLPLPAKELSLPLLDLYTSMRITDSVQDDISYFRAELNRIKSIMDTIKTSAQPYLVLLDEPLRGTNSTDKQQGTRAIVESLLTYHAIGIVATHDTGLCDMAESYASKVSNYHFESKVETNGLSFDFKLRSGASTSNNATILMRQMGIVQ